MKRQESIRLTAGELSALTKSAAAAGSFSRHGASSGAPCWRTLIRDIAAGHVRLTPREGARRDWKANPAYPPAWWVGPKMLVLEAVIRSGMSEEELTAGGLERHGRHLVAPWKKWKGGDA